MEARTGSELVRVCPRRQVVGWARVLVSVRVRGGVPARVERRKGSKLVHSMHRFPRLEATRFALCLIAPLLRHSCTRTAIRHMCGTLGMISG
jgi:hypothetical protein